MENRLKERLVGATVLVVLAVIFVPMVLDGPGNGARVERSVELPPQNSGGEAERRTVRLDLTRPQAEGKETRPETAISAAESRMPEKSQEPADVDLSASTVAAQEPVTPPPVKTIQPKPKPVDAKAAKPAGEWTVQVGSFGQQANAETQAARLKELGFEAHISRYSDGRHTMYRVRSGGFESREAATAEAAKIKVKTGQNARPALND